MQPRGHMLLQARHVGVLNMPSILAQMNGDSIGATTFGLRRGKHGVGFVSLARLAKGANMIHIDAQKRHEQRVAAKINTR